MCIYDRAGYGWSDFGIYPTSEGFRQQNDLYKVLSQLNEIDVTRGLSLFGHSAGGEYA
jgi:pimeloyl-ACP methyl ester carboxylesterase